MRTCMCLFCSTSVISNPKKENLKQFLANNAATRNVIKIHGCSIEHFRQTNSWSRLLGCVELNGVDSFLSQNHSI